MVTSCNICLLQVIVKDKLGNIMLYCKGADSTVYERLSTDCADLQGTTTLHLEVALTQQACLSVTYLPGGGG